MKYFKGIKTELTRILLLEDMQYDLFIMKKNSRGILDLDDINTAKFLDKDNYIDLEMLHNQIDRIVKKHNPDELHLQYSTDEESDKGDYVEWLIFKNIK